MHFGSNILTHNFLHRMLLSPLTKGMFAGALLLVLPLMAAPSERLSLSQIMTQEEMRQMGLADATPEAKQAFESWAANWTKHVIEQAPSYRSGENLTSWVQRWPPYANPANGPVDKAQLATRQQSNQKVDKIRNNGEIIELKDGSSWQISPFYRNLTVFWLRDHVIEVGPSSNIRYTYLLYNATLGQTVQANMKSPASPTGKKAEEHPDTHKGSVHVTSIASRGEVVTLADGSTWKIAPANTFHVINWKEHDRILAQPSDNFLYRYRLTNLDTGEVVLANTK